jgi:hypothetical protein
MELLEMSKISTLLGTSVSMFDSLCPTHAALRIPKDMVHLQYCGHVTLALDELSIKQFVESRSRLSRHWCW